MNKIGGMKQIIWFMRTYVMLMAIFILQKPLFMLATHGASQMSWREAFSEMIPVMFHGLRIDLSMASYLMLLPGLLLLAYVWIRQEFIRPAFNAYMGIIAVATSFCFVLNAVLYPYWCFPLDSTPFFYFFTSPTDAFASATFWEILLGILALAAISVLNWRLLRMPKPRRDR